jgi:hypothetical protein
MTSSRTVIGLHDIGEDGTLELDEAVFEKSELSPGGQCLVIASENGGVTVMPVEETFDPKPSGQ